MRATLLTGCLRFSRQPLPECPRRFPVAQEAEGPHVIQIALPAAFRDGDDMVGVPKGFSAAFGDAPFLEEFSARGVIQLPQVAPERHCIGAALRADAFIAIEDLLS